MAISILNKTKLFFTKLVKPSKIKINDQSYIGSKISVYIDGQEINIQNNLNLNIIIEGSCNDVEVSSGDLTINGDAKNVNVKSGDVNLLNCNDIEISSGDIEVRESCNDINSKSGDIKAVTILGNVKTISGNISYKNNLN